MNHIKRIPILLATVVAVIAGLGLTGCDPSPIVGPTGAPLAIVVSTKDPTSDLLTDYRRSITVVDDANLDDTFSKANDLAVANDGQHMALVFSKAWYDSLYDPNNPQIPLTEQAAGRVESFLVNTGAVERICNFLYVDTAIPTAGRQAIFNQVQAYATLPNTGGSAWSYRTWAGLDAGDDVVDEVDACFAEGV